MRPSTLLGVRASEPGKIITRTAVPLTSPGQASDIYRTAMTELNGTTAAFGAASRRGEKNHYCDAPSVFQSATGSVGAVVVDGVGDAEEIGQDMGRLAWAMSRTAAQRGASARILAGHHLLVDRGADGGGPSAVAVAADIRPGMPTGCPGSGTVPPSGGTEMVDPGHRRADRR
ncbi:hypothetical protein [Streptomyces sp. NPDC059816]|uniref:hypothetical protein n=1 Tax=Streptomyces sp. NPDC059816 TaxID=3346960 RepID=UPI00365A4AC6